MKAPMKPEILGSHEIHANAARYEGIASGSEKAIVRNMRPRIPESVVTHAANVQMTMLAQVTAAVSTPLRQTSVSVRS